MNAKPGENFDNPYAFENTSQAVEFLIDHGVDPQELEVAETRIFLKGDLDEVGKPRFVAFRSENGAVIIPHPVQMILESSTGPVGSLFEKLNTTRARRTAFLALYKEWDSREDAVAKLEAYLGQACKAGEIIKSNLCYRVSPALLNELSKEFGIHSRKKPKVEEVCNLTHNAALEAIA